MAWSYSAAALGTDTAEKRVNSVRLLVGDTDTNDQQVQNEEITFALSQTGDDVYYAASYVANVIASKYSRRVDTQLDGALQAKYSDLAKSYRQLSIQLKQDAQRYSGKALGVYAGGISISDIDTVRQNPDRVTPAFRTDQFIDPQAPTYLGEYIDRE